MKNTTLLGLIELANKVKHDKKLVETADESVALAQKRVNKNTAKLAELAKDAKMTAAEATMFKTFTGEDAPCEIVEDALCEIVEG